MPKIQLLVDVYNQKVNPDDPKDDLTRTIKKGQIFEASQEEADRLEEIGAALDPKKAEKLERERLDAEKAQHEARKAEIDAKIKALDEQSKQTSQSTSRAKG